MTKHEKELIGRWVKDISKHLVGKTIVKVFYMDDESVEEFDWHARAVVLKLNDGTMLYPSRDDEGNGPGSIFTTIEKLPVIPVI